MSVMQQVVYESHTLSTIGQPTKYHVNHLVWLKQPDYPWWPGIVIPVQSAGLTLPDDKDLCILCFPNNASTVAFAQSNDADEVCLFNGKRDADLISEGKKYTQCAAAINEALTMYQSQQYAFSNANHNSRKTDSNENIKDNDVQITQERKSLQLQIEQDGSSVTDNNILDNSLNDVNVVSATRQIEVITNGTQQSANFIVQGDNTIANKHVDAHVQQKQSRSRHKRQRTHWHQSQHRYRSKQDRSQRHHHHRHRHKKQNSLMSSHSSKKHKAHKVSKKDRNKQQQQQQSQVQKQQSQQQSSSDVGRRAKLMQNEAQARQSRLDEYEFEAQHPPQHYMQHKSHRKKRNNNSNDTKQQQEGYNNNIYNENEQEDGERQVEEDDAQYYYRKCRESRTRVSNASLQATGSELRRVIAICLNDLLFEQHEQVILSLLRLLTKCDVTLPQLQETHIGIIVGQLLMKSFPLRVNQLAHAILTYWFRSLPSSLQANFVEDNEIDRCSIDTTVGSRSSDAHPALGAVGVHIFESFTDEQLDDTPPQMDVIELCKQFETVLQSGNDDHDTRVQVLSELSSSKNGQLRRALLDGKITVQEVIRNVNDLPHLLYRFHRSRLRRNTSALALRESGLVGDDTDTSQSPSSPFSPMMGESTTNLSEGVSSPTLRSGLGNITTMYTCPNCGAQEAYRTVYTVAAHDNFPDILRCKQCGTTWNISQHPS